jgi:endonuclease YncB( thermonuclease family)
MDMEIDTLQSLKYAKDEVIPCIDLSGLRTKGKVVSVHDGDTIKVVIMYRGKLTKFACRMMGYDAPELSQKDNPDSWSATNLLVKECTDCKPLEKRLYTSKELRHVCNENTKIVEVEFHGREKWGRELVRLYDDNGCINDRVMMHSFNISYNGKGARPTHYAPAHSVSG